MHKKCRSRVREVYVEGAGNDEETKESKWHTEDVAFLLHASLLPLRPGRPFPLMAYLLLAVTSSIGA